MLPSGSGQDDDFHNHSLMSSTSTQGEHMILVGTTLDKMREYGSKPFGEVSEAHARVELGDWAPFVVILAVCVMMCLPTIYLRKCF